MYDHYERILTKNLKLVRVKVGDLATIDDLTVGDLEIYLAPLPALTNPGELSEEAVHCLAVLHPPIVVKKAQERSFQILGNLRTSEVCRATLNPSESIYAIQVDALPEQYSVANALKVFGILSSICYGLDSAYVRNTFHRIMNTVSEDVLRSIGPDFVSKAGRERLLGINRRHQNPSRNLATSPTSQIALGLEVQDDA